MRWFNDTDRWGAVSKLLHWLVALVILVAIVLGLIVVNLDPEVELHRRIWRTLMPLHKSLGMTALILATLRLAWYLAGPKPHLPDHMKRWERTAATVDHVSLYALTLLVPVSGWASSSSVGATTEIFGLVTVPNLVEKSREAAQFFHTSHWVLAWIMIGLLVVHISAALWHHFLVRDNVLRRMLPASD